MASEWSPATYGECFAAVYDDWYLPGANTEAAVATLAALSAERGGGPALELGIGTGRVALPLAARGVQVHGLDASSAMLARLVAKSGGDRLATRIGDMEAPEAVAPAGPEGYGLVFVTCNTFFNLASQEAQLRCMEGVARCLRPGGAFVLEAVVPDLGRLGYPPGQLSVRRVSVPGVSLYASRADRCSQLVESAIVVLEAQGVALYPARLRLAPRPSSTSWLGWPACASPSGGGAGNASR